MDVRKAAIIGAGIMGHGIAEVLSLSGIQVTLVDAFPEALEKAKISIGTSLERLHKSGKLKEPQDQILGRIFFSGDLEKSVSDADIVIEAVPEIESLKRDILSRASSSAPDHTIIASNTSNILISDLAKAVKNPSRLAGFHFFNPPVVMKLIEVIRCDATSTQTADSLMELARRIGKTPILVNHDTPGFVVNRVNAPESLLFGLIVQEKMASPESVDAFARAQGLPMGPYELMDYVGIDTMAHSLEYYARAVHPDYAKCHIFQEMVNNKRLGAKTGRGFYTWKDGKAQIPNAEQSQVIDLMDVLSVEVNEAVKLLELNVASPQDIETGVKLGMNRPFGPISVAEGLTNAEVKAKLQKLAEKFHTEIFKPAQSIEQGKMKDAIAGKLQVKREHVAAATAKAGAPSGGSESVSVAYDDENFVAVLTISNTRNNLLSAEVINSLETHLRTLWNRKETRVIILRGDGSNFSAGAQLTQFFSSTMDFAENSRRGERVFRMLSEIPKITIAEMKGYALGGGFELSLWCDLRVATPDCTMGFPEVTLGLIPGWGGSQRLRKLIGVSRSMQIILSGDRFDGKTAFDLGLVWKLFPSSDIEDKTASLARDLGKRIAPIAAAVAKRLINKGGDVPEDNGLEMEAMSMGLIYGTEDLKEGITAFLQKRKPEYRGR